LGTFVNVVLTEHTALSHDCVIYRSAGLLEEVWQASSCSVSQWS